MSLRSPPGTGRQWPQLLAYVMDDDDRTRRASFLLWNLTAALLAIGAMTIIVIQLAHHAGWYAGVSTGLSSAIVLLMRLRRTRA
jgi:uncharacterized membrane protein YhaH (DUF805 family)